MSQISNHQGSIFPLASPVDIDNPKGAHDPHSCTLRNSLVCDSGSRCGTRGTLHGVDCWGDHTSDLDGGDVVFDIALDNVDVNSDSDDVDVGSVGALDNFAIRSVVTMDVSTYLCDGVPCSPFLFSHMVGPLHSSRPGFMPRSTFSSPSSPTLTMYDPS